MQVSGNAENDSAQYVPEGVAVIDETPELTVFPVAASKTASPNTTLPEKLPTAVTVTVKEQAVPAEAPDPPCPCGKHPSIDDLVTRR